MNIENISEFIENRIAEIMPDIEDLIFTAIMSSLYDVEELDISLTATDEIQEDTAK